MKAVKSGALALSILVSAVLVYFFAKASVWLFFALIDLLLH